MMVKGSDRNKDTGSLKSWQDTESHQNCLYHEDNIHAPVGETRLGNNRKYRHGIFIDGEASFTKRVDVFGSRREE